MSGHSGVRADTRRVMGSRTHQEPRCVASVGLAAIEAARSQASEEQAAERNWSALKERFERVLSIVQGLDFNAVWAEAEDAERRVLIEELLEWVTVYPDHLEVTVAGAPPLNVLFGEVGLKESENVSVGGPTCAVCYQGALEAHLVGVRAWAGPRRTRSACKSLVTPLGVTVDSHRCMIGVWHAPMWTLTIKPVAR